MTSLFDDLKEGLQEAITFAKGEGPGRATRFEIDPVIPYTNSEIREIRKNVKNDPGGLCAFYGCLRQNGRGLGERKNTPHRTCMQTDDHSF